MCLHLADVTTGPDGSFYRWCSRDAGTAFTGTRFPTSSDGGAILRLSSSEQPMYVSNGLVGGEAQSNAGETLSLLRVLLHLSG